MPYIKQPYKDRILATTLEELCNTDLEPHNINFIISILLKRQFFQNRCYKRINDLVGAVECAKQEFIRRYVNYYEDTKICENGDI